MQSQKTTTSQDISSTQTSSKQSQTNVVNLDLTSPLAQSSPTPSEQNPSCDNSREESQVQANHGKEKNMPTNLNKPWRRFLMTWWLTDKEAQERKLMILKQSCRYLVFQLEKGSSSERPHWQIFAYFKTTTRANWIKRVLDPSVHINLADNNIAACVRYCSKCCGKHYKQEAPGNLWEIRNNATCKITTECSEDHRLSTPFFFGGFSYEEIAKKQETTGSIVMRLLYCGSTLEDIRDLFPTYYIQFGTRLSQIYNEIQEKYYSQMPIVREVHWYYGESGSGKSFKALSENLGRMYTPTYGNSGIWFDNYNGEEVLFLDDLRSHNIAYNKLLQMLDVQPFKCEGKGAKGVYARWKKIIITCPYAPEEFYSENVYKEENDIVQVTRRIHLCINFRVGEKPLVRWDKRDEIPNQIAKYAKLIQEAEKNIKKWKEERLKAEEDALEIASNK